MKSRLGFCILLILVCRTEGITQSETTTQFWWDATYYRPFAVSYRKIFSVGTRHLISGAEDWNKVIVKPSVEWYPIPFLDVMAELLYINTKEREGINSIEWRPDLGFRMNFLQQRITFRTNTRLEYRHLKYKEIGTTTNSLRFRSRIELIFPINNRSHRDPKTLYALTDYEVFADIAGEEVDERFSNRSRFRFGLGWRFDREWRVEFIYTRQNSRNTLEGNFENSDNIYRIRIKYQPLRGETKKELKEQPHH